MTDRKDLTDLGEKSNGDMLNDYLEPSRDERDTRLKP